jgi:hypothetical protein
MFQMTRFPYSLTGRAASTTSAVAASIWQSTLPKYLAVLCEAVLMHVKGSHSVRSSAVRGEHTSITIREVSVADFAVGGCELLPRN